ncbi:MAG: hypothetical protein M1829_003689 [Trizodia sp. TS-e1964]|nr:MAG: hypothetical protein M1829_003689 [Trizodia sp. TS-e1964]
MFTPLRTPGKNKRDQSRAAQLKRPKGGRPRMPGRPSNPYLSSTPQSRSSSQSVAPAPAQRSSSSKKRKPRRTLSPLETLPLELIRHIFLHSRNVNLPRASLPIAAALSSVAVYIDISCLAFNIRKDRKETRHLEEYKGPEELIQGYTWVRADSKLQSDIMTCRWMTLKMYDKISYWILRLDRALGSDQESYSAPKCSYSGFNAAKPQWAGQLQHDYHSYIPRRLLRGPWTDPEKLIFLKCLRAARAVLNESDELTLDFALDGCKHAIAEQNLPAIRVLCYMTDHVLNTETFRLAVTHEKFDREIVFFMARRAYSFQAPIDWFDKGLWNWALATMQQEKEELGEVCGDGAWAMQILKSRGKCCFGINVDGPPPYGELSPAPKDFPRGSQSPKGYNYAKRIFD